MANPPFVCDAADFATSSTVITISLDGTMRRSRIPVAKLGRFTDKRYGTFDITAEHVAGWKRNLTKSFGGRVPVDVDHNAEKGRGTEAAGWITSLGIEGDKVMADVEWTPLGEAAIRERRYLYISPTFSSGWKDEYGASQGHVLLGAALTNKPFLKDGMPTLTLDTAPAAAASTTGSTATAALGDLEYADLTADHELLHDVVAAVAEILEIDFVDALSDLADAAHRLRGLQPPTLKNLLAHMPGERGYATVADVAARIAATGNLRAASAPVPPVDGLDAYGNVRLAPGVDRGRLIADPVAVENAYLAALETRAGRALYGGHRDEFVEALTAAVRDGNDLVATLRWRDAQSAHRERVATTLDSDPETQLRADLRTLAQALPEPKPAPQGHDPIMHRIDVLAKALEKEYGVDYFDAVIALNEEPTFGSSIALDTGDALAAARRRVRRSMASKANG